MWLFITVFVGPTSGQSCIFCKCEIVRLKYMEKRLIVFLWKSKVVKGCVWLWMLNIEYKLVFHVEKRLIKLLIFCVGFCRSYKWSKLLLFVNLRYWLNIVEIFMLDKGKWKRSQKWQRIAGVFFLKCWTEVHFVGPLVSSVSYLELLCCPWVLKSGWIYCHLHYLIACAMILRSISGCLDWESNLDHPAVRRAC